MAIGVGLPFSHNQGEIANILSRICTICQEDVHQPEKIVIESAGCISILLDLCLKMVTTNVIASDP